VWLETCIGHFDHYCTRSLCWVRRLLTWSYPHLLLSVGAFSAPAAIGRYLLPTRHSAATNRPPLLLSIDGTDGWTDTRPLHRFFSAYYLGSVNYISPVIFSRLTASYESVFIDWVINWLIWLIDWLTDWLSDLSALRKCVVFDWKTNSYLYVSVVLLQKMWAVFL